MTILDLILAVKIIGTGLLVALPLMFLPAQRLAGMLNVTDTAIPMARLYGVAVLALLVGYSFGFSPIAGERFPLGIVSMGLVSNAGATATLILTGGWQRNRAMTIFLGGIALSLGFCLFNQAQAMAAI